MANYMSSYNSKKATIKSMSFTKPYSVAGEGAERGLLENTNIFNPRIISMDLPQTTLSRGADLSPSLASGDRAERVQAPRLTPRGSGKRRAGAERDLPKEQLLLLVACGCEEDKLRGKAVVIPRLNMLAMASMSAKVGDSSLRLAREAITTSRAMMNKVTNKPTIGRTLRNLSNEVIVMIPRILTSHPRSRIPGSGSPGQSQWA